jgi:hypothetical protein
MKNSLSILIGMACAAGVLQAAVAAQSDIPPPNTPPAPSSEEQSKGVRTGDWEYATPQFIPLESHPVRSWGGAVLPGPRNTHVSEPHGGVLATGARFDIPGRE